MNTSFAAQAEGRWAALRAEVEVSVVREVMALVRAGHTDAPKGWRKRTELMRLHDFRNPGGPFYRPGAAWDSVLPFRLVSRTDSIECVAFPGRAQPLRSIDTLAQIAARGGGGFETEQRALALALKALPCGLESEAPAGRVNKLIKFMEENLPEHVYAALRRSALLCVPFLLKSEYIVRQQRLLACAR